MGRQWNWEEAKCPSTQNCVGGIVTGTGGAGGAAAGTGGCAGFGFCGMLLRRVRATVSSRMRYIAGVAPNRQKPRLKHKQSEESNFLVRKLQLTRRL
jgi:hypothetical protein